MNENDGLHAALRELSNLLLSEETLRSSLQQVAFLSVRAIEECDAAGISVVAGSDVITAAGSDEHVDTIDDLQYRSEEGPCLQAIVDGRIIRSDRVADDPRWPAFGKLAAQHGVTACLAVPLLEDGESLGALNLYSYRDQGFDAASEESAVVLAAQASGPLSDMRRYASLRLAASHLIGQIDSQVPVATGVLMERERCSREEAVAALTRMATEGKTEVEDAALTIVRSTVEVGGSGSVPLVKPSPPD